MHACRKDTQDTLTGTPNHPFWVPAIGDFVPLGDLDLGAHLHVRSGGDALLVSKTWRQGDFTVFDVEVQGLHAFYVQGVGGGENGVLVHNSGRSFWDLVPTERGSAIESDLAQTGYSDWFHVGAENNGFFPLVDFQKGNTLVSVKTVDTAGSTWMQRMQSHIQDLGSRRVTVGGSPPKMVLDLRVQPGGAAAAEPLVAFGDAERVVVRVTEYP